MSIHSRLALAAILTVLIGVLAACGPTGIIIPERSPEEGMMADMDKEMDASEAGMDDGMMGCTVTVIEDGTRYRRGPSRDEGALGMLAAGTTLKRVGVSASADGVWFEVEYAEGLTAFVHNSVVNSNC
ncbi:MAG: SH3 domain-containing protein [Caldilineaceae bacterium]|nr:SH3 domain-containing protein [Caldilineaceae bacterium]